MKAQLTIMADKDMPNIPYGCKAVTTQEAKSAATETVTEQLTEIAREILTLSNRDDKLHKLQEIKSSRHISEETRHFLEITALREIQHYDFMSYLLSCKIPEFTKEVHDQRKKHDYSKDELFYFAAGAFFDGGVQFDDMKLFKDSELRRHYELEAHHPEFELYHDMECQPIDILEMAIDRLARNVQFGNGLVNLDVLQKFKPQFPSGDNEEKQRFQWECCLRYKDTVQEAFHQMFPDTKEWSNNS